MRGRKLDRVIYLDDRNRAREALPKMPIAIPMIERDATAMVLGQLTVIGPIAVASGLAWGVPGAALPIAIGGAVMLFHWAVRR
jgi:hypothetical protein